MAERLKRAAAWLGLVTDDRYADYDDAADFDDVTEDDSAGEPLAVPERPATVTPLESRRPAPVAAAATTTLAPHPRTADMSRIMTVHPRTYNEARIVGEYFRDGVPVSPPVLRMTSRLCRTALFSASKPGMQPGTGLRPRTSPLASATWTTRPP